MKNCYVNGVSCITTQQIAEDGFFEAIQSSGSKTVLEAVEPSYKDLIPPAASRRMAKGVKMGIYTSTQALKDAGVKQPDAIITGTGMGCLKDSEKFLKALLDNDEQFLTPTSFIQSTHNTIGGQVALGLQCKGYNFTYVNGAISFESSLFDAKILIEQEDENTVLIGGIDETGEQTMLFFKLVELIKKESNVPFDFLNPNSKGIIHGEGAGFFVIENKQTTNSYAQVVDMALINRLAVEQVSKTIEEFLAQNDLTVNQIDAVVLGNNGDVEFDTYYKPVISMFANSTQVYYKHLTGEFDTASAIGFWVAVTMLKKQFIPSELCINTVKKSNYNYVLLYNQYRGQDHSLILLQKC